MAVLIIILQISGWWAGIGCAAKGGVVIAGQGCGGSTSSTDKTWKEPLKVKAGGEPPLWWNTVHPRKSAWLKMHLPTPSQMSAARALRIAIDHVIQITVPC